MPNYLLLSVCLTVACAVSSAAATGEDLIPHGAASSAGHAPLMLTAAEVGKDGPTPFPKDEKDWPGVGVIRVFDFMTGERKLIWSQRQVNQGAVIFVGDSIIGGWKTLKDDFAPLHVANSGVGGDVSRGVLLRLQEDVIDLAPKAVVILIGGNDMSASEDLSLLMSNLKSILKMLRGYKHSLPIVLCKIPPGDNPAVRLDLNSRLNRLSKSNSTLVLLDLYQLLALPDGSVDPQNFVEDKIHLSPAGYKKFHDALIPIFRRLKVE